MTDPEGGTGDIPKFFHGFLALALWVDWRTTDWHESAYGPTFNVIVNKMESLILNIVPHGPYVHVSQECIVIC
jgi:hypothetical protein